MRALVFAMGALLAIGLVAVPEALETFTGIEVPAVVGSAQAVWCGPDENNCCYGKIGEKLGIRC